MRECKEIHVYGTRRCMPMACWDGMNALNYTYVYCIIWRCLQGFGSFIRAHDTGNAFILLNGNIERNRNSRAMAILTVMSKWTQYSVSIFTYVCVCCTVLRVFGKLNTHFKGEHIRRDRNYAIRVVAGEKEEVERKTSDRNKRIMVFGFYVRTGYDVRLSCKTTSVWIVSES